MEPFTTDVLIVGAGPTGLSLAAQFIRWGVDFTILDPKDGPTDLSKAVVVHARTLEIYDQMGLADAAVRGGEIAKRLRLMQDGEVRAHLEIGDLGGSLSPFPFLLVFEQSKNEQLLKGFLDEHEIEMRWGTALESLTQDTEGVTATVKTASGETQTIRARYLAGCDGAGSPTRHQLGLGFEGSTFPRLFYVADVEMDFRGDHDSVYAAFGPDAFVLLFPFQDERHWRMIGNVPGFSAQDAAPAPGRPEIPFESAAQKAQALVGWPLGITHVRWFSTYRVHTRHAEAFQAGRCFLAGDAAHVHTPAGGQGMNTGIQDAYNLAWKLALVLRGDAEETLLTTYHDERIANAKRLLHTTDQMFDIAASDHWAFRFFRSHLLPGLLNAVMHIDAAKEVLLPTLSQIGIHYRESRLSDHSHDGPFSVKAGDRMPFFSLDGQPIYDRLRAPAYHLLVFFDGPEPPAVSPPPVGADLHLLPLTDDVRRHFGVDKLFHLLLRPDNHLAWIAPGLPGEAVTLFSAREGR